MEILRTILTVIYVIDCIALTVVVLMQEGKQQGLGAIAGISDTYWGFWQPLSRLLKFFSLQI